VKRRQQRCGPPKIDTTKKSRRKEESPLFSSLSSTQTCHAKNNEINPRTQHLFFAAAEHFFLLQQASAKLFCGMAWHGYIGRWMFFDVQQEPCQAKNNEINLRPNIFFFAAAGERS